ncbi:toll-like receptor 3 [Anopheles aquasalis]|uniref:toll-like receptor 3 n=1 Tax=Anopheles aquasalis TaxID=42839 RepID=UPI00215A7144|nr:toll-like receptor 3 [Anopheles aquasalis]
MMVSDGQVWRYVCNWCVVILRVGSVWFLIAISLHPWIGESVTSGLPVVTTANVQVDYDDGQVSDGPLSQLPEQIVAISIKEELMKLKGPDSYLSDERECILGQASFYLSGWLLANATINRANAELQGKYIDISYQKNNIRRHFAILMLTNNVTEIAYVSLAHRNMTAVPYEELQMVNSTVTHLSMAGNNFYTVQMPSLQKLLVLDLRNCALVQLAYEVFATVPNLEQLYLSHNYLLQLTALHMRPLSLLRHLDLAYNSNGPQATYQALTDGIQAVPDPYTILTEGMQLSDDVFEPLERLTFLDLSHTKLLSTSARAFRNLAVEQLSLCYTGISLIVGSMMHGTLRTLDISGNPGITAAIHRDANVGSTRGLNGNIEILACENASVKYLDWVHGMTNLRVLLLGYNSINQLTNETFASLARLEVLDLNANHVSNWHWRIFAHNPALAVLDLSANNLNVLTTEMLSDFERVRFLAIGENNFICHCLLRDFLDMASFSPSAFGCAIRAMGQYFLGIGTLTSTMRSIPDENAPAPAGGLATIKVNAQSRLALRWQRSKARFGSFHELNCSGNSSEEYELTDDDGNEGDDGGTDYSGERIQLIDYRAESYRCRDVENVEHDFIDLERCTFDRAALGGLLFSDINNTAATVVKFVLLFFGFALVAFIIYISKWEYVKYFCIIVRNATILSLMRHKREHLIKKDTASRRLSTISVAGGDLFVYDVFVSYSENDRSWVLNELLPNLERSEDISVCLHERDFKVGVSILENIIHCMDRSRTLLLVMSESFLLSHWCQFEMHLAQHRLLETRREHLILVLLEEIPKIKRPKTLHYLMKTKTYIRWPTEKTTRESWGAESRPADQRKRYSWRSIPWLGRLGARRINSDTTGTAISFSASSSSGSTSALNLERKLFWMRLKKSIHDGINWEPEDERGSSSQA